MNISHSTRSGFTLVELLVVTGVFFMITSVVLARYRTYNVGAEFTNAVEGIVLALREAQVYGSGSKAGSVACGPSAFNCAFGVNFTNGGTSYTIFADTSTINNAYDSGEAIQTVILPSGVSLSSVSLNPLNIVFKRPFPDATINNSAANTEASITVSQGTKSQTIRITSTGLISVQ